MAFSFETSRSLPNVDPLLPKVARFNDFLLANPEAFPDLQMWHWCRNERSADYRPQPISDELVRQSAFVFMGSRQKPAAPDPNDLY